MRLIDADKLCEDIMTRWELADKNKEELIRRVMADIVTPIVVGQQTVDAVAVVRCKDCRWWDKKDGANYGYCHAAKHGYFSKHWEISIYRTYKPDFYCADGERRIE